MKMIHVPSSFYVIGNCCNVVSIRHEFRQKFLLVFAAEQTLFYVIGNCCNVVVVKQEFRQKFLLEIAAGQSLF